MLCTDGVSHVGEKAVLIEEGACACSRDHSLVGGMFGIETLVILLDLAGAFVFAIRRGGGGGQPGV